MQDIADAIGHERVAAVVDLFYNRVRMHARLQVPFARVHDWPAHKALLTHFWWVTLGGPRYISHSYEVARRHEEAGFTPELLADWLALFRATVQELLPDELAAGWIERAERIGRSLRYMHEAAQRGEPLPGGLHQPLYKPA